MQQQGSKESRVVSDFRSKRLIRATSSWPAPQGTRASLPAACSFSEYTACTLVLLRLEVRDAIGNLLASVRIVSIGRPAAPAPPFRTHKA